MLAPHLPTRILFVLPRCSTSITAAAPLIRRRPGLACSSQRRHNSDDSNSNCNSDESQLPANNASIEDNSAPAPVPTAGPYGLGALRASLEEATDKLPAAVAAAATGTGGPAFTSTPGTQALPMAGRRFGGMFSEAGSILSRRMPERSMDPTTTTTTGTGTGTGTVGTVGASAVTGDFGEFEEVMSGQGSGHGSAEEGEYHLHVYAHKHNTHITFTKPDKDAVVSMSVGQLGIRKGNRGSYDAAYQLAARVFQKIEEKNVRPRNLEVVLRGFGQGREAVVKSLLGNEGKALRPAIRRVTDSTRLKFGGTRSKAPRRLG